jgi:hypothetical protein
MTTPYTLPEPHITEWSKRGWANNFYAKYPPHDADITISLFTTEMMDAAYQAGAASRDGEVEALRAVIKRVQHIALIDPPHTGQMMEIAAVIAAEATK